MYFLYINIISKPGRRFTGAFEKIPKKIKKVIFFQIYLDQAQMLLVCNTISGTDQLK